MRKRNSQEALQKQLNENKIEPELQSRILEYLNQMLIEQKNYGQKDLQSLFELISKKLLNELNFQGKGNILKNQKLLSNNFSKECVMNLSIKLTERVQAPNEIIFHVGSIEDGSLQIIKKGKVELYAVNDTREEKNSNKLFRSTLKIQFNKQEKYCMIKDKIIISRDFKDIYVRCANCQKPNHEIDNCQFLHQIPDKEKLIKKFSFPQIQERAEWTRVNYCHFKNALKGQMQIQAKITSLHMNQEILKQISSLIEKMDLQEDVPKIEINSLIDITPPSLIETVNQSLQAMHQPLKKMPQFNQIRPEIKDIIDTSIAAGESPREMDKQAESNKFAEKISENSSGKEQTTSQMSSQPQKLSHPPPQSKKETQTGRSHRTSERTSIQKEEKEMVFKNYELYFPEQNLENTAKIANFYRTKPINTPNQKYWVYARNFDSSTPRRQSISESSDINMNVHDIENPLVFNSQLHNK